MEIKNIGYAIARMRKQQGYTQKQLADAIGVSDKAVSKWERGVGMPDTSLLPKLSILLDTDIESLLSGDVSHHAEQWCGILVISNKYSDVCIDVAGKPMIDYLMSYFMLVGIRDIMICSSGSPIKAEYLERIRQVGIDVCTVEWVNYKDIVEFAQNRSVMLCMDNLFIYGTDLTKFIQRAMKSAGDFTALAVVSDDYEYDIDRKIIYAKGKWQKNVVPMYFLKRNMIKENARDIWKRILEEDDICLIKKLIRNENLYVEPMGRGMFWTRMITDQSISDVSTYIKIVEQTMENTIADVSEIALKRGYL